ncbi:MAG TPA: GerMN domain-containing protein, partial [Candidatus Angelobacter sp.]
MIPRHFRITIGLLLLAILVSGILIIQLRRGEQVSQESASAYAPQLAARGTPQRIRILVAYDDELALRWREAEVRIPSDRGLRVQAVLRAVLAEYAQRPSPHALASASDVRNVYFLSDDTLLLDMTPAFADGHPSGILLEQLTLASLLETLTANVAGINRVKFLVDGKERETL